MNRAVLSDQYPQFSDKLRELGYEVIPSDRVECFIEYEQDHADMQCLVIDGTAFVLECCQKLLNHLGDSVPVIRCKSPIEGKYPHNVVLNAALVGKNLICRVDSLDEQVKEYCAKHGYQLINVNQGYAKCSCAIVSDNAVITADHGIYNSLRDTRIEVLMIEQGRVGLQGADYGFIGGASGYDKARKTLYFCGDIATHPYCERIRNFCEKHGTKIVSLSDGELTDIGGIVFC